MSGMVRTSHRYWNGGPDYSYTYYACHHDPANPRHTAKEGHPRSISVREDDLLTVIREGLAQRVFGPERAELLAATLPDTAADDQARRDAQTAALQQRLRQIDAAENAHAREIEALTHDSADADSRAVTALRSRILARFTELEDERATIDTQLAGLAAAAPAAADPALLDNLPILGDILADAPVRLWQQLLAALDIQALYNKNLHQVTIHATITDATPRTVAAIINDADDHPTTTRPTQDPEPVFSHLAQAPICR
jgi:site-specific DNA recombinase